MTPLRNATRRTSRLARDLLLSAFTSAATVCASDFTLSPYAARAIGQAGAFTARAADPSAVSYNPAAIARLQGLQLQLGLGFDAPRDTYKVPFGSYHSGRGEYLAEHRVHRTPAAYLTWHPGRDSRWAFGLGFDSPVWHRQSWPVHFPGAYRTRAFAVEVWEIHPVAAFALGGDERWSVGAGIRYLSGRLRDDYDLFLDSGRAGNTYFVRGERSAEAEVEGWAADVSVSFRDAAWGFGAALSSGAKLDGIAEIDVRVLDVGPPVAAPRVAASVAYLLEEAPRRLGIDLAPELRVGTWIAPRPELRLELDVALGLWSAADWDRPRESPRCGAPCSMTLPRDWRDTLSGRLGAEGDLTDHFRLAGGIAYEPSPVPDFRLEPGVPQGDAWIYAIGASFDFARVSFDLGYSFHDHRSRQESPWTRYSSSAKVFAVSARYRF